MKIKLGIALLAAFSIACVVPITPKPPTPPAPTARAFDLVACRAPAVDNDCAGAAGTTITLSPVGLTDPQRVQLGDANGYAYFTGIPLTWTSVTLTVTAPGYVTASLPAAPVNFQTVNDNGLHNFVLLTAAHVDPSSIPLEQLAAIRGAMWPQGLGLSIGPRPGSPDNIIATDFFADYSPADQASILAWEKQQGYTHVVMGPIVDSDGYHGIYTAHDWRTEFDAFLDVMQTFWDNGQAPIVFIHPDGWTLEQTQALTPLFQSARAQRLMRIVVPTGWEPTQYGWSSCTWAGYVSWARATWPNALVLIHTVADVDAPVGTDALCDDNGKPNGDGWARVVNAGLHGWLIQNGAYTTGPGANPMLAQNFAAQFDPGPAGATAHGVAWHFATGASGWPTSSTWGPGIPIRLYNAECTSYTAFWQRPNAISEPDRQAWGDLTIASHGNGYLDGGSVPVKP